MAFPRFPVTATMDVVAEFGAWQNVELVDASETVTKLIQVATHGMVDIDLFGRDRSLRFDMFLRERKGWGCIYLARSNASGNDVVALCVKRFASGYSSVHLEGDAWNRRRELGL